MNDSPIVFDTNCLIDFVCFTTSFGHQAVRKALQENAEISFSEATFAEFKAVLERPKFDRYIEQTIRQEHLRLFADLGSLYTPTESIDLCRDPEDNKFLELALAASAQYIVSRDEDLLVLDPFQGIKICTPKIFIEYK